MLRRSLPGHLAQTVVVFDELRLVYVPVPKAGCTAILWALSEIAGLTAEDFGRSRKLEVARELAVHDMSIWGLPFSLEDRTPKELQAILRSPDWFRLTVVREPMQRLWSAWVSKVLVRDPRFVRAFGDEDWFPPVPSSSQEVLESFRRFARALPARVGGWHDPHWSPQVDLTGVPGIAYAHVGRLEQLERFMAVLGDYLAAHGRKLPPLRVANRSLLPFVLGVFDRSARDAGTLFTLSDRDAFGYEPLAGDLAPPDEAWHTEVNATIPAIRAVIERNERIVDLQGLLKGRERTLVH